jgi:hypothetical protein
MKVSGKYWVAEISHATEWIYCLVLLKVRDLLSIELARDSEKQRSITLLIVPTLLHS